MLDLFLEEQTYEYQAKGITWVYNEEMEWIECKVQKGLAAIEEEEDGVNDEDSGESDDSFEVRMKKGPLKIKNKEIVSK